MTTFERAAAAAMPAAPRRSWAAAARDWAQLVLAAPFYGAGWLVGFCLVAVSTGFRVGHGADS